MESNNVNWKQIPTNSNSYCDEYIFVSVGCDLKVYQHKERKTLNKFRINYVDEEGNDVSICSRPYVTLEECMIAAEKKYENIKNTSGRDTKTGSAA